MEFKQEYMGVFVDNTPKCVSVSMNGKTSCQDDALYLIRCENVEFWVCERCLKIYKHYNKHSHWNIVKRIGNDTRY